MNAEMIFGLSNAVVLPFWVLMIVLPRWRWTLLIMRSPLVALPPALIYAILVLPQIGQLLPAVSNPQLSGIATLLGTPAGATIAWAHFVAFDLLIGRWAYLDSQERGVHPLLMAPILFFVLMLGPIGYCAYLIVQLFAKQQNAPEVAVPAH